MTKKLPAEKEAFFKQELEKVCKNSRMLESGRYMQHGCTSVFRHSVSVAHYSLYLAWKMHIPVDEKALIRGALLHDYFLYDWHEKDVPTNGMDFITPEKRLKTRSKILN